MIPDLPARLTSEVVGTALLLATVGIYGVMAFSVRRRTRDIGIRIAVGADEGKILSGVLRTGIRIAGTGTLIGAAAALALTRIFESLLYDVRPADPATYAAVAAVLSVATLLACLLPARRAARIDPSTALRSD